MRFGVVFALLTVIPHVALAQQPQDPAGSWSGEQGADNFYMGGSASDGTYLYLIGGFQSGQGNAQNPYVAYRQLRRYDPANDTWSTLAQLPNPTLYNAGAYSDGRLFSFGGYAYTYNGSSWSGNYSNLIHAYTVSTNSWTTLSATLTSARYYLTAAAVPTASGDRIYVMGGTPGTGVNDEFNPSTNTVTGRMPVTANGSAVNVYLHASAGVASNGKVYVIGGLPTPNANVYEFTPPTSGSPNGSWVTKTQVQNGGGQAQTGYYRAAFSLGGRVYLTGGVTSPYTQVFEYAPATDTWAQRAGMSGGRYGHAAAAVGSVGIVYGGYNAYTTCEQFTPPDFGSAPNEPTSVAQTGSRPETTLQAKPDESSFDGWTNQQVVFSANATDPNAGQQVRLRVQVKQDSASWSSPAVQNLDSGLQAQGDIAITWTIPQGGGYDWRYRVEDTYGNSHPAALAASPGGWIEAFGTEAAPNGDSPDFRSDQMSPTAPVALSPASTDLRVGDPNQGDVLLEWTESTDNGPVSGISYEVQVATDGGFHGIEAQLFSPAGKAYTAVSLSVSREEKHWRMRARDVGGNLSEWTEPLAFRVTYNDGVDHSSGDAGKTCAFGASASGVPAATILVALTILAFAVRRGRS